MNHFANHDIHWLWRQVFESVGVHHLDFVAVRIHRQHLARRAYHIRIELDAVNFGRLGRRKPRQHARTAAQFEDFRARLDGVINGRLKTVHPVLIHQHVVMVVDWNKLPQVATFDFAFVQHGFPLAPF